MLTANDFFFAMLLPLVMGIIVAAVLRWSGRPALGRSGGMLVALVAGYFCRYGMMNFAYVSSQGETDSQPLFKWVTETVFQTTTELIAPGVAIAWIPILSVIALAVTLGLACFNDRTNDTGDDTVPQSSSRLSAAAGLLLRVVLAAAAMIVLLKSSVYFSDDFSIQWRAIYVGVPAVLVALVWAGRTGHCVVIPADGDSVKRTAPESRWQSLGSLLICFSAMVLLGTSGSFSYALLQIPVITAIIIGASFFVASENSRSLNDDRWLIASAVCLPVILGYFFAEVTLLGAGSTLVSALLLAWMPVRPGNSLGKKIGTLFLACLPAMAAAAWAAIQLSQAISDNPYRS